MTAQPAARASDNLLDRPTVGPVAMKAFFNLASEWGLATDQQIVLLGRPSRRTYYRWKNGEISSIPHDTLERISVLLGIYRSAHTLLPVPERANAWVKRANRAFNGESALDVMLGGRVDDLYQVRRYLDAWRV